MAEESENVRKREALLVFGKAGLVLLKRALRGPFLVQEGTHSYRRDVLNSSLRVFASELSFDQIQYGQPSTETMYKLVCRGKRRSPDIVDLGSGAKGFWIGRKDAKCVMLYIHGGGFVLSATHGHFLYQFDLQKILHKQGHSFAIFSLSYTLAPGLKYPGQLIQAATALQYLLEKQNRQSSSIMLAGDSAGGNLVSALLLHIAYPHPSGLVPPINLSSPLQAVLLVSPWISFTTSWPSFHSNARSDYITRKGIDRVIEAYVGSEGKDDYYQQPINAPVSCWITVVNQLVNEIMICAGGGEILFDQISAFARVMENAFSEAKPRSSDNGFKEKSSQQKPIAWDRSCFNFVMANRASHDQVFLDHALFRKKKDNGSVDIERWLRTVLGSQTA